mmetsp:Transcript_10103/g.19375  ORF Transcript_10103/g.19375 Transcript_10103/m.19375 type:complete len:92 (-) Transcript_10103:37-312(-)
MIKHRQKRTRTYIPPHTLTASRLLALALFFSYKGEGKTIDDIKRTNNNNNIKNNNKKKNNNHQKKRRIEKRRTIRKNESNATHKHARARTN